MGIVIETITIPEIIFTVGGFLGMVFFTANFLYIRKDDSVRKLAKRFGEDYDLIIRTGFFKAVAGFLIMLVFFVVGLYSFSVPSTTILSPGGLAIIIVELLVVGAAGYDWYARWIILKRAQQAW